MNLIASALALMLLFPASHAARGAQDAGSVDVVRTDTEDHDRLAISLRIDGAGPYRFLLDTGAQNTVVATSLASTLGLAPSDRATIVSVAGTRTVETVAIDGIELGRRRFSSQLAPLLQAGNIGADGILGLDSLQDQRVLLDFERNAIAIDDAASLGGNRGYEIVVTARRRQGQLIISNALIDGIRTRIVIDTGAEITIGNRALQRALSTATSDRKAVLESVTGQTIEADMGSARSMTLDGLTLRNISIAFADAPPFAELELDKAPALLLGMKELRAFRRVAIDFRTRKVLFDLRSGR